MATASTGGSTKFAHKARSTGNNIDDALIDEADSLPVSKSDLADIRTQQIVKRLQCTSELLDPNKSNKFALLMEIIRHSIKAKEKVLVFSHSLETLALSRHLLKKANIAFERLDGDTKMEERQSLTKHFNSGNDKLVFLISTRAGGTGLNLYGASRVVIMDDTFNPTWEQQAIGRAYRIGQMKHVYVYRLLVSGSFEERLQNQALFKLQLSSRVVDQKDVVRHAVKGAKQYIFPLREPKPEHRDVSGFVGKDVLVLDKILSQSAHMIHSIQATDTFLEVETESLTAEEQRDVEESIRLEKLRRKDPEAYKAARAAYNTRQRPAWLNSAHPVNPTPITIPMAVRSDNSASRTVVESRSPADLSIAERNSLVKQTSTGSVYQASSTTITSSNLSPPTSTKADAIVIDSSPERIIVDTGLKRTARDLEPPSHKRGRKSVREKFSISRSTSPMPDSDDEEPGISFQALNELMYREANRRGAAATQTGTPWGRGNRGGISGRSRGPGPRR